MNVIIPQDCYTYLFFRNGIPFYVGKGQGNRIDQHFACARNHSNCEHLTCRVIRKELREGGKITAVKIAEGIPEPAAFRLEKLYISLGAVYHWPLVNQTFGGEGVSGYVRDADWRKRRSELSKQLAQEGKFDYLKTINIGREQPAKERNMRRERSSQAWSDSELIEQQRQRGLQRFADPEEIRKQKERFADPALRVKCGEANKGKEPPITKDYQGFVSPEGIIHAPVHNLAALCRQFDLHKSGMCLVAQGKQASHKGWTRYPPIEKHPYKGPGFVSPSGEIFADIPHLSKFCQEHGLHQTTMSEVSTGTRKSHKGWTRYNP